MENLKGLKVTKLINFPADLVLKITEYQKENNIQYFTEALFELVAKGLKK